MASTKLDKALLSFAQVSPHFGPRDPSRDEQLQRLRQDLKLVNDSANRYFVICVALVLILFAGACAIVVINLNKPGNVAAVLGADGLSFVGIFGQMLRLWKEKVNSDMLIVLAGNLETADLRKIVNALLKARLRAH